MDTYVTPYSVCSVEETYILITRREYTPCEKQHVARCIASIIFEDKVDEDTYDSVVENEQILAKISGMIGRSYPDSLLRQIQSYDVVSMITDEKIEDAFFLLHQNVSTISRMKSCVVSVSRSILCEQDIQKPFLDLVSAFIQTHHMYASDSMKKTIFDHIYDEYFSEFDKRIHERLYAYVAVRVIEKAYRSYKLRVRLPVVANKARLKDEIEYRPLTGIKYFEVLEFFEKKEWL